MTDGATPTITKNATPYDGEHVLEIVNTLYTPIFTTATEVLVAASVTRAGTQQSRAARLDPSTWAAAEDVQLRAATHDSNIGHRGASIAQSGSTIHAAGAGHNDAWHDKATSTTLSALAATADPTGPATRVDYPRYYVNRHTGDTYTVVRAGTVPNLTTRIYKWGGSSWALWATLTATGAYGGDMAFAADGTIYVACAFINTTTTGTGFPRYNATIVKTTDGTTWTDLAGNPVTLPLSPTNLGRTPTFAPGQLNLVGLALDSTDSPVMVAAWAPWPDETYRSLWQATWDGTRVVLRRILDHPTGASIGDVHVAYDATTILVTVGQVDTIDDPDYPTGPFTPGKLWLLTTTDGGQNWTRYELHDGAGASYYSGAYLDPESLRLDGKVRMIPMDLGAPTNHEVWELTLP